MLERYFVFPRTVDRIRNSWIGEPIERHVEHLAEQGYAAGTMHYRVPLLVKFGEFARSQGAKALADLPAYAEDFIADWIRTRGSTGRRGQPRPELTKEIRGPVEQFLRLVVPGFIGHVRGPTARVPFVDSAPGFFGYLSEERGLRPSTLWHYGHHLRGFEDFLNRIDLNDLRDLTPPVLAAFVADSSRRLGKTGVRDLCGTLRMLLRYLYRERVVPKDLSRAVDAPHAYRLSHIPRSVTWEQVRKMLSVVERRMPVGKRDYAILLLLVTYGLRAREVAALMLDHIDWKRERLHVPERKADHATAYPLSTIVGDAIVDYLQHGRPNTTDRHLFFRSVAPCVPLTYSAISCCASHYLRKAGIPVSRAGSHTLRHSCVQRLVDADFSLKVIGDYVGHRVPASTEIYSKVAVEALRKGGTGRWGGNRMKLRWQGFHGPMAALIERYLTQKRALGCRFRTEERALQLLDRFLLERGIRTIDEIEPALLEAFLASRPRSRPRSYNHLLCVVRRLFDWLVAQGELACSPVQTGPRRETARRIPFLFNAEQARRLLDAAIKLPDASNAQLRGHTYRTMFALLYGLGLRVGEVSRLCGRDVDFERQLLVIRDTKFSKSRLVPFGPRIGQLLQDYLERRAAHYGPLSGDALLFSFDGSKAISPTAICGTFHRLFDQLKLPNPPGASRPRVHDLRHSFAVGTLLRWYREGIDPSTRLLHLSTFLGHVDPASTAVYLTITPELLAQASWRFERYAGEKLREVFG